MGMSIPGYLPGTSSDASMHPGLTVSHPPTSLPGYLPGALPGELSGALMHPIPPGPISATSLPGYLPGALPGAHSGAHMHPIPPGPSPAPYLPGYVPGINSGAFAGANTHPALHPVSKPGVLYPITTATVPVSSQSYPLTSIVTPGYPGMSMHPGLPDASGRRLPPYPVITSLPLPPPYPVGRVSSSDASMAVHPIGLNASGFRSRVRPIPRRDIFMYQPLKGFLRLIISIYTAATMHQSAPQATLVHPVLPGAHPVNLKAIL